jgi:hypothetical protein
MAERILSVEPNACEFCIAFYLCELLQANPQSECVIRSKDKKGFDPLVKHLTVERGFTVRRVSTQKETFAEARGSPLGVGGTPADGLGAGAPREEGLSGRGAHLFSGSPYGHPGLARSMDSAAQCSERNFLRFAFQMQRHFADFLSGNHIKKALYQIDL